MADEERQEGEGDTPWREACPGAGLRSTVSPRPALPVTPPASQPSSEAVPLPARDWTGHLFRLPVLEAMTSHSFGVDAAATWRPETH